MAPITDTAVDELKGTVSRLEQRIVELENKLTGHGGSASSTSQESVRMILMGPPGAGERIALGTRGHC
jgi:adenylate kinase